MKRAAVLVSVLLLSAAVAVHADTLTYQVAFNVPSGLVGASGVVDFDIDSNTASPAPSATITSFVPAGSLGSGTAGDGSSGSLASALTITAQPGLFGFGVSGMRGAFEQDVVAFPSQMTFNVMLNFVHGTSFEFIFDTSNGGSVALGGGFALDQARVLVNTNGGENGSDPTKPLLTVTPDTLSILNGSETFITQVPEPATLLLLGSGIVGLMFRRRSRTKVFDVCTYRD